MERLQRRHEREHAVQHGERMPKRAANVILDHEVPAVRLDCDVVERLQVREPAARLTQRVGRPAGLSQPLILALVHDHARDIRERDRKAPPLRLKPALRLTLPRRATDRDVVRSRESRWAGQQDDQEASDVHGREPRCELQQRSRHM